MDRLDWLEISGFPIWAADFGKGLILLSIIGIALSFLFRTKPWIALIWVPTFGTFAGAIIRILMRITWLGQLTGPGALGGIELVFLVPMLLAWTTCLVACYFARPREITTRWYFVALAILIYLLVPRIYIERQSTYFKVTLVDLKGDPLVNVPVEIKIYEAAERGGEIQSSRSDADGALSFRLEKYSTAQLAIKPVWSGRGKEIETPMSMGVGIAFLQHSKSQFTVTRSWQHSFTDMYVQESFTEVKPRARNIDVPVLVRPQQSFEPGILGDEIRDVLVGYRVSPPLGIAYGNACNNFESIAFIPLLIETYRRVPQARSSAVGGLSGVATMLSNLDSGCRRIRRFALNQFTSRDYVNGSLANEILELSKWAKLDPLPGEDRLELLERVRRVIAGHAQEVVAFGLEEMPSNENLLQVLQDLGTLGRPAIPQVVRAILTTPPANMQAAYTWSHFLWSTGAQAPDLMQLINSENPTLVLLACRALENDLNEQMISMFLKRLHAVRSNSPDGRSHMLVDDYIKTLEARAKILSNRPH